jgi:DNA-binding MltR family transcriptional regulator
MSEHRPLEETHPHLREFTAFLAVLNKESDRGAVLIAATMLEDLLGRSINSFLVPHDETERLLEGFNAPLGTFSSRILAAYSLGILSENEYRECDRIRKIRNVFAHNVHCSFEDQKVRDMCATLGFSIKDTEDSRVSAKAQFTSSAVSVILNLTNRPHYVGQRRLKYGNWQI